MTGELDSIIAASERQLDALATARERLSALRASAVSDEGWVTATVDSSGALIELTISDDARGGDPDRLAAAIVAAAGAADALIGEARAQITEQLKSDYGGLDADGKPLEDTAIGTRP